MSFVINTNTLSLTAQQNLNSSQKTLNSAIERLSSGSKINSAKDDAAGQAISNRMTSQINGLQQASSNANDGISLAQTTEGALNQVNDNLQRIRELTVQASNGTNSGSDLTSIQNEINQRLEEINRISEQTSFNGTNVLDGSKTTIDIQVGDKDGQTISINLSKMDSQSLGLDSFNVTNAVSSDRLGAVVNSGSTAKTTDITIATDSNATAATSDGKLYQDESGNLLVKDADTGAYYAATNSDPAGITWDSSAAAPTIDGNVTEAKAIDANATTTLDDPTNQSLVEINDASGNGTGEYLLKDTSGAEAVYNKVEIAADGTLTKGEEASVDPLADLDSALKQVDDLRSDLGAVQNRLDSAISNISTTTINISSARSRITDADYATEVSNMSKAQILQQAGTSVLAQANQTSQGVLSLLR